MWFYKQGCTYYVDVRESEQTERGTGGGGMGQEGAGGGRIQIFRAILWRLTRPVTRRRTKWVPTNNSKQGGPSGHPATDEGAVGPRITNDLSPPKTGHNPFPPHPLGASRVHRDHTPMQFLSPLSLPPPIFFSLKLGIDPQHLFLRAAGLSVPSSDASSAQGATDGCGESSGP